MKMSADCTESIDIICYNEKPDIDVICACLPQFYFLDVLLNVGVSVFNLASISAAADQNNSVVISSSSSIAGAARANLAADIAASSSVSGSAFSNIGA